MLNSFSALSTKVMTRQGTGVHTDLNVAAGGLTKSFLEIRLPYVRLVHYPGSAPALSFLLSMHLLHKCILAVLDNQILPVFSLANCLEPLSPKSAYHFPDWNRDLPIKGRELGMSTPRVFTSKSTSP